MIVIGVIFEENLEEFIYIEKLVIVTNRIHQLTGVDV